MKKYSWVVVLSIPLILSNWLIAEDHNSQDDSSVPPHRESNTAPQKPTILPKLSKSFNPEELKIFQGNTYWSK